MVLKPAWGKDQPNNYNGEQNCVVLDGGRNWLWNDVGCNLDYLHFICQHGKLLAFSNIIYKKKYKRTLGVGRYLKCDIYHFLFLEPLSCGSPDSLQNTTVSGRNYTIGSSITYSCPSGHALIGNGTRECLKSGDWNNTAPTCKCKFLKLYPVFSLWKKLKQNLWITEEKRCKKSIKANKIIISLNNNFFNQQILIVVSWLHSSMAPSPCLKRAPLLVCRQRIHVMRTTRWSAMRIERVKWMDGLANSLYVLLIGVQNRRQLQVEVYSFRVRGLAPPQPISATVDMCSLENR